MPSRHRSRPTVLHLALTVPWIGLVLGSRHPIRDNSFLWHVTAGRLQLASGTVLTSDPFSYTRAGVEWRTQSWLAELAYARLDEWFGISYLPWMLVVIGGAAMCGVMLAAWRRTWSLAAVAAIGVSTVWVGSIYLNPRPVLFSYLFLALTVLVLESPRLRWVLPLLFLLWASVHGSFVIGVGVVALDAWRRENLRHGIVWGAGLAATTSVTAHGVAVWTTLVAFAKSGGALDLITEWAPPDLTSIGLLPVVPGVVLLLLASIRGRLTERDLWIIAPMLLLAVSASRSVFPAWLVLAPLVATGVAVTRFGRLNLTGRSTNLVLFPILVMLPFAMRADLGLDPLRFPIAAAECVDPNRPLFHDDVTGGYLIYAHHPSIRVFVDDRAELYGEEQFRDVLEVRTGGPRWRTILAEHEISQVLVASESGVVDDLISAGWSRRYADERWMLLDRDDAGGC